MIEFIDSYFNYKDERGSISGVINKNVWEEINFITSEKGAKRGGHYHKYTKELFFILEGEIEVITQIINSDNKLGKKTINIVKKDDIFLIEPNVVHYFKIIEDSKWINVLTKKIDKDNPDMFYIN
jgi:dTDP-4-dehydrorhamnose 3,5-epimerase-like enzyme